ncbi:MAG: hypothetical protein H6741_08130 [Alphaproteobacteria bacterium]|nr:hypothetical protein [Alphaproteobacteria bacterium]
MQVYVFGNGNLSFSDFLTHYLAPLEALDLASCRFLVCDFRGVDTLVMEALKTRTAAVSVFHVGQRPRYLPDRFRTKVGAWELVGGFAGDADRDAAAIARCTHFLALDQNSDAKRKSGTLRNIEACLALGRVRLG